MGGVYIVEREQLPDLDQIRAQAETYCKEIIENGRAISFVPKDGFLATLGLFFSEKAISYHLEFKK